VLAAGPEHTGGDGHSEQQVALMAEAATAEAVELQASRRADAERSA